jgi:hypothetical protein
MLNLKARTGRSSLHPRHEAMSQRLAWAETVLREQKMTREELRIVLTSADGDLVRRHLALHLERLDERLVSQRQSVETVSRILAESPDRREGHCGLRSDPWRDQ